MKLSSFFISRVYSIETALIVKEETRMKLKRTDKIWQWDYKCDEFLPNYLGHIIHYIEGMIMEVRDRK